MTTAIRLVRANRLPLTVGAVGIALTVLVAWWSIEIFSFSTVPQPAAFPDAPWIDGLIRWDSFWYHSVATEGYVVVPGQASNPAFFPAFPLLIRLFGPVFGNPFVAGVVVALVAGVAALVLLRTWLRIQGLDRFAPWVFATLLLFPASYYLFGVMYAESLFLAFAIAAFVLVEKRMPVAAGLVGACAVLTRPVGIVLAAALALRQWEIQRSDDGPRRIHPGVLLAFAGLPILMVVQWAAVDDPLAFLNAGSAWGHGLSWETVLKMRDWRNNSDLLPLIISQLLIALGALALVPMVWRRFGHSYALYVAGVVLLPVVVRPTILGGARYVLAAFPIFALLGLMVRPARRLDAVAMGVSVALWLYYLNLFSRRFYVG